MNIKAALRRAILAPICLYLAYGVATAQESHRYETEAEKLEVMRKVMSKHMFHYFSDSPEPVYCRTFREQLQAGQIKAVEPYLRIESMDDSRLEPWQKCGKDEHEGNDFTDPKDYFLGLEFLGGPPFRFYRLELDGNRANGKEDVVYHEPSRLGGAGYHWVDLKRCISRSGVGVSPHGGETADAATRPFASGRYRLNTLVMIGSEPTVFEVDDEAPRASTKSCVGARIAAIGPSKHSQPRCTWTCYPYSETPFSRQNRSSNKK
jgi:hypothetical protein